MQIETIDSQSAGSGEEPNTPGWQYAVSAGIAGWILDAFDFFVIVFLIDLLAGRFHVSKEAIVWTISITLAMRPVGAVLLGAIADRFGRRWPLAGCVLFFSAITLLSGFAPNYLAFAILRILYGIGMGGYWGVGAALAMEQAPRKRRGLFSGLMQSGYAIGYLLAAVAMITVRPLFGWRAVFCISFPIAGFVAWLAWKSPEIEALQAKPRASVGDLFRTMLHHKGIFLYLLLLMSVITCLSHGTQDLYPDFLKSIHGFSSTRVSTTAILYNLTAIAGALIFGQFSETVGRRGACIAALIMCLPALYPWAYGTSAMALIVAACWLQCGVQGAFGVIPAHLNELSPEAVRSLFPGVIYQLGVLISSPAVSIEYRLRSRFGYQAALVLFESCVIVALLIIVAASPERQGRSLQS